VFLMYAVDRHRLINREKRFAIDRLLWTQEGR